MTSEAGTRGDRILLGRMNAAIDMIGRSGAEDFELSYDEDPIRWRCHATWEGFEKRSEEYPYPAQAVEHLLARTVNGGLCTACARVMVLDVVVPGYCGLVLLADDLDDDTTYRYVQRCKYEEGGT